MTTATFHSIPQEPGRWQALAMAAIVHVALFILLWVGIRWQSETPVTIEAEVWSPQVQEPAPVPEPVPAPIEKPNPVVAEPSVAKPDIALEQIKKRKAEEKERLEKIEQKEKEKRIADEKAAELIKKNKAIEKAEKVATEKKRLQDEADEKQLAKLHEDQMRRNNDNTVSGSTGDAAKSSNGRADPGYGSRLSAKIKSHTRFVVPPDLRGNPSVEYTVELFPDGTVRSIKLEHSSQLPGFDEAVERAIRASSPFPPDRSGNVPQSFSFPYTPKEK